MRYILILLASVLVGTTITSCAITGTPKPDAGQPIQVSIRATADTAVILYLDGKVIDKHTVRKNRSATFSFLAPLGVHVLKATAPGHNPWERTIQVVEETTKPQYFYVPFEKK